MGLMKKKNMERQKKKLSTTIDVLSNHGYSLDKPPPSSNSYLFAFFQSARSMTRQICIHEKREIPDNCLTKKQAKGKRKAKRVNRKAAVKRASQSTVAWLPRDEWEKQTKKFYNSQAWKELRYEVLRESGGACTCCGARASDGVRIHVDHIKPRSKYPELQTSKSNLQVLCEDCNFGKSNYYNDDWRAKMQ